MSNAVNSLYEFGGFRLDTETGTLWRGNDVISLSPKAAELLTLLLQREGQLVSKQEIFDSVWAGTFVEDGVLTQNIYTLRNALGRDDEGKQFIETVPRRGYRFAGHVTTANLDEEVAAVHVSGAEAAFDYDDLSADLLEEKSDGPRSSNEYASSITTLHPLVSSSAPASHRRSIRPWLFSALGFLILGAVGFGIYQLAFRGNSKSESAIAPIEQVRFQNLTDSGDVIHPTISPDGELLAFVRVDEEQSSVWIKQIATDSAVQALPPSRRGYRSLAFSSDGKFLFFREHKIPGSIYQTSVYGGPPKKIADNVWSGFSISPDGKRLAFVRRNATRDAHLMILCDIDGGGERELSMRDAQLGYIGGAPAWSPDGTKLIIASGSREQPRPLLLTIDVDTGKETELNTPKWREISRSLWMPDGKHLIVAARAIDESTSQIWMLDFPDGKVSRLTNDLENYFWLSLSADGRKLVGRQQKIVSHLWLLPDGDIKKARQLTFGGRNFDGHVGLAWTPDGKIVFSVRSGQTTDLYSINPDGSDQIQLTANAGKDNTWPAVSRNTSNIVFTSRRTGTRQIWRMDSDGRNQKQLTFGEEPKDSAYAPVLSPDGSEVFFIKLGKGPAAIWKVSIEGGTAVPVSHLKDATAEGFLSISPDGKFLAYRHLSERQEPDDEDRTILIGVLPVEGGEPKFFDLPMRRPIVQWSSNHAIDYSAGRFVASSLWRQPLSGGERQKLLDFPDRVFTFAWSTDGKNLVVARGKMESDAILISNLP
jgi:Tol biopolymer transport system component/DNA-binding winged helix-turn-helix (wHTH) protein